jgi:multiple sugar transport system substrate-binding protein
MGSTCTQRIRDTAVLAALAAAACSPDGSGGRTVITFPGSAVGSEAVVLERQIDRFMRIHPDIQVVQRQTPDAANQRHQLYVQWLNAGASSPDVLQLDVVWTPEFAAAGWVLPLDRFGVDASDFFPATISANRWADSLYALPWFVDVGMLYWRTDLMAEAPRTLAELARVASATRAEADVPYGFVWQGARYEGLVTVFLEHLGAFGGAILTRDGRVGVDSEEAVRALTFMRDAVYVEGYVPEATLTWHEEETRFAFQNGQAAFMRNWPYAYSLLAEDQDSRVVGRFSIAPMPAGPGGQSTAALGGSQLAVNANSRHPEAAWALIDFLTRPEQMLERARVVGQYPTRRSLFEEPALAAAIGAPVDRVRDIVERATPRPVSPVYTQLSEILQIRLHRALTRQESPRGALSAAATEMRDLLDRVGLAPGSAVER